MTPLPFTATTLTTAPLRQRLGTFQDRIISSAILVSSQPYGTRETPHTLNIKSPSVLSIPSTGQQPPRGASSSLASCVLNSCVSPQGGVSFILDLETLDTSPSAIITEIGIIAVDRETFKETASLLLRPNILEQLAAGRTWSKDTIGFHFREGSAPTLIGEHSLDHCAAMLHTFFFVHLPHKVWIQGPDFDRPIIESFLAHLGEPLPWKYYHTKDARTTWDNAFPGSAHAKRPHHALPDCRATLACIRRALEHTKSQAAF